MIDELIQTEDEILKAARELLARKKMKMKKIEGMSENNIQLNEKEN